MQTYSLQTFPHTLPWESPGKFSHTFPSVVFPDKFSRKIHPRPLPTNIPLQNLTANFLQRVPMHFFFGQIPLENPPRKFPSTQHFPRTNSRGKVTALTFPCKHPQQIFGIITPRNSPMHFISGQIPVGNSSSRKLQNIFLHFPENPPEIVSEKFSDIFRIHSLRSVFILGMCRGNIPLPKVLYNPPNRT